MMLLEHMHALEKCLEKSKPRPADKPFAATLNLHVTHRLCCRLDSGCYIYIYIIQHFAFEYWRKSLALTDTLNREIKKKLLA